MTSMDFRMDKSAGRRSGQGVGLPGEDLKESKGVNKQKPYRLRHLLGIADDRPPLEERGSSL